MTEGPDFTKPPSDQPSQAGQPPQAEPTQPTQPTQPYGQPAPPPYGQQPYGQPAYGQQPYGAPYGAGPAAPWGVHPVSGLPYSDKSKLVAGLLQVLIPLGIGRFYMGFTGLGVAQLLVTIFTCGIGALWPFIDGIVILATDPVDAQGRPLKPS